VAILAAVPAVATFIGLTLIGVGGIRLPVAAGLLQLVIGYALALVTVYLLALITDALAPTFGGTRSRIGALKLIAYASTAGFIGGIFNLIPMLSVLGLLAAIYSMVLIYTGLPVLMQCPAEKAAAYAAVVIVCGLVATVILAGVTSMVVPAGPLRVSALPGTAGATARAFDVSFAADVRGSFRAHAPRLAWLTPPAKEAPRRVAS